MLQAFGNAKTQNNHNSSRFGKFIQIIYFESSIKAAKIEHFLLERSRVLEIRNCNKKNPNDRGFHIFDMFLNNLNTNHYYLSDLPGVLSEFSDAAAFKKLLEALEEFKYPFIEEIWIKIASIMHLSLISIQDQEIPGSYSEIIETLGTESLGSFQSFCRLSKIPLDKCITALFFKKITIKGELNSIYSALSPPLVRGRIDSLCIEIYCSLFEELVDHMNQCLLYLETTGTPFIGILDIFGLESLQENSLEQLCINYTNERLFAAYINQVYTEIEGLYQIEQIQWESNFTFLSDVINLIDGKMGIFNAIQEQCRLSSSLVSSKKDIDRLSSIIANIVQSKGSFGPIFQLTHFSSVVSYDCSAFIQKNRISPADELKDLMGLYFKGPGHSRNSSTLLGSFQVSFCIA